jgi:hypothetical protein
MIELQRNFLSGVMNKDLDPHFLPDGTYREAYNIIVGDSDGAFVEEDGSRNGVAQNYLGNILKGTDYELTNATCIGSLAYETNNSIYWLVASDTLDAIYEYNETTDTTTPVLQATKATSTTPSLLGFDKAFFVTGINYINGLLFWTDNLNPPRRINIDRAKNYAVNGFTEADINVILAPPLSAPTISSLYNIGESNNLENSFLYFAYRYKYLDNEYSALSPFSPVAFFPKQYAYDYGVAENISMVNNFNTANVVFNSGDKNVKEIQLVYRDSASLNTYIIDNLIKLANNYGNNQEYTYVFNKNKVYSILPQDQVTRLFDNVPIRAKSQELIGSRLVYGNYTQFFNLLNCDYEPINPSFTLDITTQDIVDNNPKPTFKSNRDYEIGIVYLDSYGRTSTVITPTENTNTIFIPPANATKANNIRVTISGDYEPPCFATHYRFMLKQNRQEYYNVFPLTYFSDGQFKWFLISQPDVNKISVGSYLYLKLSSTNTNTQYKVLAIESQSQDFLNTTGQGQPAGVYFKIKIDESVLPNVDVYNRLGFGSADFSYQTFTDRFDVAEDAIFYGIGLNDMIVSDGNSYSGDNDSRFYIQVQSIGLVDKYKVYVIENGRPKTEILTDQDMVSGSDTTISYLAPNQTDPYVFKIRFATTTGHSIDDYWVVNCRNGPITGLGSHNIFGGFNFSTGSSVPSALATNTDWNIGGLYVEDRPIKAGAILTFKIRVPETDPVQTIQTFVSTKEYVNIEEWFVEDGVYQKWSQYFNGVETNASPVTFRRGYDLQTVPFTSGVTSIYTVSQGGSISPASLKYPVWMRIVGYRNSETSTIYVNFDLQQQDNPSIFETVPVDSNLDVYYELSKTYPIINGNHIGNVQNQNITTNIPAIVSLNTFNLNSDFNAFSFGNGVESYRIRDDFNSSAMQFSPRANSTIEGYEEQTLVQALSYSGVYTQTSAINRLNEFNLSLANFKYLDRFFGSIQKLFSRDTDLVVFQENKVSKVLYGKNLLSDSTGGGAIASVPEVLGTQISYEGEYGISLNPESFARWGDNLYFTDARRGAVMALQQDGLFEISSQGMKNWFKANLDTNVVKLGMMDPYFEHYTLCIDNDRPVETCSISVTPTTLSFDGTVQKKSFYIQSNTDWVVLVPANDWLTVSDYYGSNNGLIYVDVLENTGAPRNLDITVSGCTEDIIISVTQATKPLLDEYYVMHKCSDGSAANSISYPANTFEIDDRVTSGGNTYVIDGIINYDPSGSLLAITATGLTGCPTPPTYEWYILYKCSDGSTANSQSYAENTFELNNRVTSGGNTYIIDGIVNYNPGGTLLAITNTGLVGCPTPITYYELAECSPGVGYAYTTIVPGGVGQRYVLPYPTTTFYTYTGGSLSDFTPPSGYNGSIQITGFYSCP